MEEDIAAAQSGQISLNSSFSAKKEKHQQRYNQIQRPICIMEEERQSSSSAGSPGKIPHIDPNIDRNVWPEVTQMYGGKRSSCSAEKFPISIVSRFPDQLMVQTRRLVVGSFLQTVDGVEVAGLQHALQSG